MSKSRKRLTKRWSEPAPGAYLHFKATRQAQSPRRGDAVIRVYDAAGNVIETHEHQGGFKEWPSVAYVAYIAALTDNAPRARS
jgi:hypothetical protein